MSKVIVYTLKECPTCDKARRALTERGVEFEERRVDDNPRWWDEALQYSFSVPVIIWGENDIEIGWEGEHG
ncbi:MAG TPA: glutaredoxin family protein [Dehalococcoidia bacterium]|nr:glutaredoxin family protein [Dehalococcoidia bacterium]